MAPPAGGGGAMQDGDSEHAVLDTGAVTDTAFAVARGLGYVALALAIGGLGFMVVAWLPGLAQRGGAGTEWVAASERFVRLLKGIVVGAVMLGLVATAAAIVLEAATATGTSFWAALDTDAVDAVSDTRPVRAWTARLGLWLLIGVVVLVTLHPRRAPGRRAALGAVGTAPRPALARAPAMLLGAAMVALALTAAIAGHAGSYSPSGLLVATDVVHVLSMSAWLGGLAMLLVALPIAVGALSRRERIPLVAAVVGRFSRLAGVAVALLLLTGIVQSVVLVNSFEALVDTAYGRLVLGKIALFAGLIALGAYNRRRLLPRLEQVAGGGEEPERAAGLLRRSVASEVGLALIVLGVASVLVATEPAVG
jgi:copper transport protein